MGNSNKSINDENVLSDNEIAAVPVLSPIQNQDEVVVKVPLDSIFPDPRQPRKYFDDGAMDDLTNSVRSKGVLQAIIIRPYPDTLPLPEGAGENPYMLVVGERRWRASRAAGLSTIPATIRNYSDDEAREVQIIENLQRKDVRAMEEARSFLDLRKTRCIEEIALRVGKSPQFVAQRLKLNDLIEVFQNILSADKMKLADAVKLCRLHADAQKEICKNCNIPKDWPKQKDWQLGSIDHYINNQTHNLDKAPFKTDDAKLYPKAGACTTCPLNSGNDNLLFTDLNKKKVCHNSTCFNIKCTKAFEQKVQKSMENPEVLFVATSSCYSNSEKAKVKKAEELGAVVLGSDLISEIHMPQKPKTWEEYRKQKDNWSIDDNLTNEQKTEAEQRCKNRWQFENDQYQEKLKNYKDLKAAGQIRKAFVVTGWQNEGKTIEVMLRPKKGASLEKVSSAGKDVQVQLEINRLNERETRNQELDREKVNNKVSAAIRACEPYSSNTEPLQRCEIEALVILLMEKGASHDTKKWLEGQLNIEHDYRGLRLLKRLQEVEGEGLIFSFFRRVLLDVLISQQEADREKHGKAAAIYNLSVQYLPEQVAAIEKEQKEKTDKRRGNVQKRLKAAQAMIANPKKVVEEEAYEEEDEVDEEYEEEAERA